MNLSKLSSLLLLSMMSAAFACGDDGGSGRDADGGIGDGDGDGDGDGPGDGDGDGDGTGDGDGDGDGTGPGSKWDLGIVPDAGGVPCGGDGDGEPEFSYLWAANSTQGTISKIDTQTVTEVGRFYTSSDGLGNPSRTSVSASGHMAVGNRNSGVAKFYATTDECQDTNGTPGIQTSTDLNPLTWDEEECRA